MQQHVTYLEAGNFGVLFFYFAQEIRALESATRLFLALLVRSSGGATYDRIGVWNMERGEIFHLAPIDRIDTEKAPGFYCFRCVTIH